LADRDRHKEQRKKDKTIVRQKKVGKKERQMMNLFVIVVRQILEEKQKQTDGGKIDRQRKTNKR
jgi:hypothetical protein